MSGEDISKPIVPQGFDWTKEGETVKVRVTKDRKTEEVDGQKWIKRVKGRNFELHLPLGEKPQTLHEPVVGDE
jgi:hypothetical protein